MDCAPQVLFTAAVDPEALAMKLRKSPFFQRNAGVPTVEGRDVRCTFGKPVGRQKIAQACSENFRKWGAKDASHGYAKRHVIKADDNAAAELVATTSLPAASPTGPIPVPGAEFMPAQASAQTVLATRSPVEDCKRIIDRMTTSECHAITFYAALKLLPDIVHPQTNAFILTKRVKAEAFSRPAAEWQSAFERGQPLPYEIYAVCECPCECRACCGGRKLLCWRCGKHVCEGCHDNGRFCHHCQGLPKVAKTLPPPDFMDALAWYFHHPFELVRPDRFFLVPLPWPKVNRDTTLDPKLLSVEEVYQINLIDSNTAAARRVLLPPGWDRHFEVECTFEGCGDTRRCRVNLFAFLMNTGWKKRCHDIVSYLEEHAKNPSNHAYMGPILSRKMQPVTTPAPPSPPSPWGSLEYPSSVRIEEVVDHKDEDEDDKCSPEEIEELTQALAKRRRVQSENLFVGASASKD